MRKIFLTTLLTVALVFTCTQAKAADSYLGTYRSGYDAYLVSGSAKANWVRGSSVIYINYEFNLINEVWHFSNSQNVYNVVSENTPVERRILLHVVA